MKNAFFLLLAIGIIAVASLGACALNIGIVTDIHAHDTDSPIEGKVMTNYPERLEAFVEAMNTWPADLVIELGDFVNGNFVLGAPIGAPERIVTILDAQYDKDGNDLDHAGWVVQGDIPEEELRWLESDLAGTDKPTIVSVHQRLDVDFLSGNAPEIMDSKAVQKVLEDSGVVIAVFQGHDHENAYTMINGIHYIEFDQLVDEGTAPSWAYVTLDPEARTIKIVGEGEQADWELEY